MSTVLKDTRRPREAGRGPVLGEQRMWLASLWSWKELVTEGDLHMPRVKQRPELGSQFSAECTEHEGRSQHQSSVSSPPEMSLLFWCQRTKEGWRTCWEVQRVRVNERVQSAPLWQVLLGSLLQYLLTSDPRELFAKGTNLEQSFKALGTMKRETKGLFSVPCPWTRIFRKLGQLRS